MPRSEKPGKSGQRVIKRYSNRKLYDTELKAFTTLDELSRLVESGVGIVVKDHTSGADRTDEVLAQVLGRRVKGGQGGDLLAGLLRAPAQAAIDLTEGITGAGAAEKAAKAEAEKKAKKKAKKKKAKAAESAQERELRELRGQVSDLTSAVSALLQERLEERGKE